MRASRARGARNGRPPRCSTSSHPAAAANPRLISAGTVSSRPPCTRSTGTPKWEPPCRRGLAVAVRGVRGGAAQQPLDHAAAHARRGRPVEVRDGRLAHCGGERDARVRSPGRPERQVPACRVPDRGDAPQVERRVDLAEVVDGGRRVVERRRPATAGARADAPVLDVPGRPSTRREVTGEVVHQVAVVARAPAPAVDQHDDRVRPGAAGQEELGDLAAVAAVAVERGAHTGSAENGTSTGAGRSG